MLVASSQEVGRMKRRAFLQAASGLMIPAWMASKPVRSAPLIIASGSRGQAAAGGGVADGASYSFTSNVSISAPPSYEWLGGSGGVIDAGTNGVHFTRTNWQQLNPTLSDWLWSTSRTLSRSKSLMYDGTAQGETGNARGTYHHDCGASGWGEMYSSCNYYWQMSPNQTQCQWKIMRWQTQTDHTGGGGPEVVDNYGPSGYIAAPQLNDDFFLNTFYNCNGSGSSTASTQYFSPAAAPTTPHNTWIRIETYMKENTTPGTANGLFRCKMTRCSDGAVLWTASSSNRIWRGASDVSDVFRYLVYQNYFGNGAGINGNVWENSVIFMDDLFHSWVTPGNSGGQRRIELINASTHASATLQPAIQEWTAGSGTSRTVKLNLPSNYPSFSGCYLVEFDDTNSVATTVGPLA